MRLTYNNIKNYLLDIQPDKKTEVFNWGADNLHPDLIEALISGSVTASNCTDRIAKAIYGKGFGDAGKEVINSTGQTLNQLLRIAAKEWAKHANVFIHVSYDADLKVKALKVIPCGQMRVGKADDLGYSGKYIKYNDWGSKFDEDKAQVFPAYTPNKAGVKSQIAFSGGILKFQGSILHIQKDTNVIYSQSDLFPVQAEALTEKESQTFRAKGTTEGFLNTKVLVTQPFADDDKRRAFIRGIQNLKGAENSGGIVHIEAAQTTDDLQKTFILEDLTSQYDDKLFSYSDEQAEKNICKAYSVPLILVNPTDSSAFGNSGESLKQARIELWESQEETRDFLTETINGLLNVDLEIINPYL